MQSWIAWTWKQEKLSTLIDLIASRSKEVKKIENIACWIKNLKSDAEQLKVESDNLLQRRRVAENKAESLKTYLQKALEGEKFKTPKVAISYRKTKSVDVNDISQLPEWALKFSDPVPNKTEIKKKD